MKKKLSLFILFFGAMLVLFAIHQNPPQQVKWYPPCLFKKTTGFDCPGCGGARASYNLLHGDIPTAANHNLLLLVLLPVSLTGIAALFSNRFLTGWNYMNKPAAILLLILLFWLMRNLPFFPFSWLHSDN